MACKISILTCPIGASGGQCTFEVLCCGGLEDRYSTYVLNEGDIVEACCQDTDLEPAIVVGISGSVYNTSDPCSSYCGDLDPSLPPSPATPAPAPAPAPTPTPAGACQCYQLLYEDAGTATINYTACGGGSSSIVIDPGTFYYICSTTMPTTSDPAVTISAFGSPGGCSQNIDCDPNPPSPSPAPTPTPTPTPAPGVPAPAPSVPTPTPVPSGVCTEWTLSCPSGSSGCSYNYVDCFGSTQSGSIPGDSDLDVCVLSGNTPNITGGSASDTGISCTGTPSPLPSPSPAPTPTPAPGVPAPTPTPGFSCTEWLLTCPSGSTGCSYSYVDCFNNTQTGTLPGDSDLDVCVRSGTTPNVNGGGATDTNVNCSGTPTPTPATPTPGVPTPSAPSPTPTPTTILCTIWTLTCPSGPTSCSFSYVDCSLVTQTGVLPPDSDLDVCVVQYQSPIVNGGNASDTGESCPIIPTPTPTAPSPSPTPTPAVPNCTEWELTCPSGPSGCNYSYTNCNGTVVSGNLPPDYDLTACVKQGTTPNVQGGSAQNTTFACGATPVPTSAYEYRVYEKCNDSNTVQVFYAPNGYIFPQVVVYNNQCFENPEPTGTTTGVNILGLDQFSTCEDCLASNPDPNFCLGFTNTVAIVNRGSGNEYEFNGQNGNPYGTSTGTYTLLSVPSAHPIAILNYGITSFISYTGTVNAGTGTAPDGRTYTYYSGDVTITVNGDYGTVSYACKYHGYMGGQNNLAFNPTVCSIPPAPSPAPAAPSPTPTPASVVPPIPSPVETEYTLTYSQQSQGWPSFYSFIPDYMLGMNQYFYSFYGGNLFQHNSDGLRNNFYNQQYNSQITTVFNQNPLENKIFKTINLESDQAWQTNLETDIQINGFIDNTWFEEKEGSYFAYLRQRGEVPALTGQYALRSANGIGKSTSFNTVGNTTTIYFSTNPIVEIGNIISIGDYVYFSVPSYTVINLAGQVTNINVNIPAGINEISIDTSISGTQPMTVGDSYILYIKNSVAESHGLLGHYCVFTLINESSQPTELFAVESEVMKSYP